MRVFIAALFASLAVAATAAATPPGPPVLSVAAIHAAPPIGKLVRVYGIVIDSYYCPPCPPDMTCKPCPHDTSVTIVDPRKPKGPSLMLAVDQGAEYLPGAKFHFDITVRDRTQGGFDGLVESMGRP